MESKPARMSPESHKHAWHPPHDDNFFRRDLQGLIMKEEHGLVTKIRKIASFKKADSVVPLIVSRRYVNGLINSVEHHDFYTGKQEDIDTLSIPGDSSLTPYQVREQKDKLVEDYISTRRKAEHKSEKQKLTEALTLQGFRLHTIESYHELERKIDGQRKKIDADSAVSETETTMDEAAKKRYRLNGEKKHLEELENELQQCLETIEVISEDIIVDTNFI